MLKTERRIHLDLRTSLCERVFDSWNLWFERDDRRPRESTTSHDMIGNQKEKKHGTAKRGWVTRWSHANCQQSNNKT
jgi:hypothetical protein